MVGQFLTESLPRVAHLQQLQEQMNHTFKEVVAFYGEDASTPEEFFSIFNQFLPDLEVPRACIGGAD